MTDYKLHSGPHSADSGERCAMEWVAYLAGEGHTDRPRCVDPFLIDYCIELNDLMADVERQRLRPYLARTIGTVGDGVDRAAIAGHIDGEVAAYHNFQAKGIDFAMGLLDAMLPTVPLQLPVAADADLICAP